MTKMTLKYDSFAVETERLAERYREERAEAQRKTVEDFPTFSEWQRNRQAERYREERAESHPAWAWMHRVR